MNSRERVLAVLDHQAVDRIPVDLWYTPEIYEALVSHFGASDPMDLYGKMGLDKIAWICTDYKAVAKGRTLWGCRLKEMEAGDAHYSEIDEPGLKGYDETGSLDDYPYWPDPDQFDYDSMIRQLKDNTRRYVTFGPWVSFFEVYCQLRGLEQSMMDLALSPKLADAIFDRIEECQTQMLKRLFERAGDSIDLMFLSDDMGSQESLLISLDMWDRYLKDRMIRWCDLAHSYGLKVFYHTDGAAEPLVSRLIDVGIDVLNPIQHVCPGMEMKALKMKYGKQIAFHGGVENQSVLPFGSAAEVRRETLDCLQSLAVDGTGYICCSCHNVQPGTPIENIVAMVETVRNYSV